MSEKDNEQVVVNDYISPKTLKSIMKRFLCSKATDDERTKWYRVEDGLHYMATTLGSSVDLIFNNKYAGTFNKIKEVGYKYVNLKDEESDEIYEYVEFKEGKKKVKKKTGHIIEYPDVKGLFDRFDLSKFDKVTIESKNFQEIIDIHDSMISMGKLGGTYFSSAFKISNGKFLFTVYDCKCKFMAECEVCDNTIIKYTTKVFIYNPEYMSSVFKTLKDLKVDYVDVYISDGNPMLFLSENAEYTYKLAFHRKLIRKVDVS